MERRAHAMPGKDIWFDRMLNRILAMPAILALSAVLAALVAYSMTAPPSFDGAMNLNTAVSFLSGRGYGFFYDIFFPFAAQTDGPLILPAALAIGLGGVTPFTAQVVNLCYVIAFSALGFSLFRRFELPAWLAISGVLMLLATPGFVEYGMNGYGEIPVMVWYWAGLLALGKSLREDDAEQGAPYRLAAGALFGLAYLTKVVALIVVAPAFVVYCLLLLRRRSALRKVLQLCAGFVALVLIWEVFRFVQLEGLKGFSQWWSLQLGQIFSQSGAGQHVTGAASLIEKGPRHFSMLGSLLGLPAGILMFYLITPPGVALLHAFSSEVPNERRLYLGAMAVSGILYFVWWLFLSPSSMAWLRRILDGVLIIQFVAVICSWSAVQSVMTGMRAGAAKRWRAAVGLVAILPVLVAQIGLTVKGELITQLANRPDSESLLTLARTMEALPVDAVIFGTGWWKAPVLAFFSGRQVSNIQRWQASELNALPRKFFVVDAYAKQLARDEVADALALMDHRLIAESEAGAIYEVLYARDYVPFASGDEDVSRLSAAMDFSAGDYAFKRGFFGVEAGAVAWMRPEAAVMLRRVDEDRLRISIVVPDRLFGSDGDSAARLRVGAGTCLDESVPLSRAGRQQFQFFLNCPAEDRARAFKVTLSVDRHLPPVRQIDADNRLLGLLVQSVGVFHGVR